ncbi:hypothetical protein C5167_013369 [Papaver somniferum]|uniref:Uncharacterized protein n=1 Tax=Papaver somniferum TaxID=3469 RepID=A0A4Y7J046_PAPSO|nr:hypothetical protein C5167_013369 [Papaver somniferum]
MASSFCLSSGIQSSSFSILPKVALISRQLRPVIPQPPLHLRTRETRFKICQKFSSSEAALVSCCYPSDHRTNPSTGSVKKEIANNRSDDGGKVIGKEEEVVCNLSTSWIDLHLPKAVRPYAHLARLHKLSPTWSITLASPSSKLLDIKMLVLFGIGSLFLRSVACVINDILDRDIDAKVERTKSRPLASGFLTPYQGLNFLVLLYLGFLLQLNNRRVTTAAINLLLSPHKEANILGWAAIEGSLNYVISLPLYVSGVFWTLVYDTIYAHQDKEDDLRVGVKSTAILFGDQTKVWITGFGIASIITLWLSGYNASIGWPFYVSLIAASAQLAWQIWTVDLSNPADCSKKQNTLKDGLTRTGSDAGSDSNSDQQGEIKRRGIDLSQGMIKEAIAKEFNVENQLMNNPNATFRIVDLGCSVGSNCFTSINDIIEGIDLKFKTYFQGLELKQTATPEFQVYFNDIASNDFNTLFASIPLEKHYFASGVPGSFYGHFFPRASVHFINSSTALHWLSRVPKETGDIDSSASNKGRIHYTNASDEVFQAYSTQYVMDMEAFLLARGHEIVYGGLMFILVPAISNETLVSQTSPGLFLDVLGSCLMEMAKMFVACVLNIVDEAKVDSFNLPVYFTSSKQVKELIERTGCFTVERLEKLETVFPQSSGDAQIISNHTREVVEEIIKQHFGLSDNALHKLFDLYSKKLVDSLSIFTKLEDKSFQMFLVLKPNDFIIAS